jgi:carbamoyltransferase
MEFVSPVKPEARRRIPGVTHVDGTARVQTVGERANPLFHRLIARFADLTGVACILNTSFNSHGQPIVCTPEDAFACFERTGLRRMMIGDRLVAKSDAELSVDTPQNAPRARVRP